MPRNSSPARYRFGEAMDSPPASRQTRSAGGRLDRADCRRGRYRSAAPRCRAGALPSSARRVTESDQRKGRAQQQLVDRSVHHVELAANKERSARGAAHVRLMIAGRSKSTGAAPRPRAGRIRIDERVSRYGAVRTATRVTPVCRRLAFTRGGTAGRKYSASADDNTPAAPQERCNAVHAGRRGSRTPAALVLRCTREFRPAVRRRRAWGGSGSCTLKISDRDVAGRRNAGQLRQLKDSRLGCRRSRRQSVDARRRLAASGAGPGRGERPAELAATLR